MNESVSKTSLTILELLNDINYHILVRDYLYLEDFRQYREQVCKPKLSKWYQFFLKKDKE